MQSIEVEAVAPVSACFGRRYAASEESCPRARRDVVKSLPEIGLSKQGTFAASIYISELFTNAILHHKVGSAEQVHVAIHEGVEDGCRWVGIAVTDAGCGSLRPSSREGFGHGLEVARGLGARITDVRLPGGYTVTAWTPVSDELRSRVCRCDCRNAHGGAPSACSWVIEERDEWEQAVVDDDPTAYLCGACLLLLPDTAAATSNNTNGARAVTVGQ